MNNTLLLPVTVAAIFLVPVVALGGPPLVTDDTGVLDQGGWEFTLAAEADKRDVGDSFVAPGLEVAYGFGNTMQGSVSVGRAVIDDPDVSSKSDFDAITFEWKWLFYEGEKIAVAIAPSYALPQNNSSTDRGIIDDARVASLPVIASYRTDKWALSVQLAYEIPSTGDKAVFAGAAAGYALTEALQLLAEIYKVEVSGDRADETNWNIGFDYGLSDELALLFSFGGNLSSNLSKEDELDQAFFLGFRYQTD